MDVPMCNNVFKVLLNVSEQGRLVIGSIMTYDMTNK